MKSCKLPNDEREDRRRAILAKRHHMRVEGGLRTRAYIQYKCTQHQHSSAKQRARYARQMAAGQLRFMAFKRTA